MFTGDIEEFVACILGEKEPDYSSDHDWWVHESLLASCDVEPLA